MGVGLVRLLAAAGALLLLGAGGLSWEVASSFGERGRGRGELEEPGDVAVASDGSVVVLDLDREAVVVFSRNGRWVRTIGGRDATVELDLKRPSAVEVDESDRIWVVDGGNHRVLVMSLEGVLVETIGSLGGGELRFRFPSDLAIDHVGRVYVADTGNDRIQVLTARGEFLAFWDAKTGGRRGHLEKPVAVAFTRQGEGGLWVLNRGWQKLERFDLEGEWDESREVPSLVQDFELAAVAVESGFYRMYLSDVLGRRIIVLNRRGELQAEISAPWGGSMIPRGLIVDRTSDIYVADMEGKRVLKYRSH